jgi:PBP1b-binding outer membrane lipoprotein LpoB
MKTKKNILLATAFVAILISSCSKDESSTTVVTPTTPSCAPNSFVENDTAYAELTYNSDKSIKTLKTKTPSEDTVVYNFVYSPNKLVLQADGMTFKTFF